ncbi:MAG: GAF domain-containing protein [Verrucomicrobiaceae bacterium]|nr:MAG: GAF domain-containing protein [Verrucomicrobiaceae bacterium]
MNLPEAPWELDEVIVTGKLEERESRAADVSREARVTGELMKELARMPEDFFPKLVQAVLDHTKADSSGISLLDVEAGRFVWPAVVGGLKAFIGAGTPSDFGPCGTVLDRDAPVLFAHPERHFTYLQSIRPSLEEVLLVPFHVNGEAVGTIWAVVHEAGSQFEKEDLRFLKSLSRFAAKAYQVLTETGMLNEILAKLPKHEAAVN